MKNFLISLAIIFVFTNEVAAKRNKFTLIIAPATLTSNSITLLWKKQFTTNITVEYEIFLNEKWIATTNKTNYTISQLIPSTSYKAKIVVKGISSKKQTIKFTTLKQSTIFNILDFGAKADTSFLNTKAIQATINACTEGGTVLIPKGIFVSGALFLKSNMTLQIEKDAVLKGSIDTADYLPLYLNRFEGWELNTYASLLNAGTLNRNGSYNVQNIRITGGGTISGGGKKLGNAMIAARGIRSRGRLICLVNCKNVSINNLTITEPPSWTIHYIYSNNICLHNLKINTYGIRNGDGIDPDSSTDSYIFNCTFDNGDDCIAIKSGKNPEGYYVGKPTKNVQITNCNFIRGHGISIGSEMSGGVSEVLVQDCKAGALINGMQIKGTKERGGYVKNVTVESCELMKITIFSKLNYNNDGEAAPQPPMFKNFIFKNIDLSKAFNNEAVININGFSDTAHLLSNVSFTNITLPQNAKVIITDAKKINFNNVHTTTGAKPEYVVSNGVQIIN